MNEKQLNNFMSKVSVSESGCWIWTGAKMGNGYGVVRIDKVNKPAIGCCTNIGLGLLRQAWSRIIYAGREIALIPII